MLSWRHKSRAHGHLMASNRGSLLRIDRSFFSATGILQARAQFVERLADRIHVRSNSENVDTGDVLGCEQFSHLAGWQGFHAARNALLLEITRGSRLWFLTSCSPT